MKSLPTSRRGERAGVKLVADANVLLTAVIGGRAALVLQHPEAEEIETTAVTFAEAQEYGLLLGRRKGTAEENLQLTTAALPVSIVPAGYRQSVKKARQLLDRRDPDDVELLALVLRTGLPPWSNDNDFEVTGVHWFTTAQPLARLGISSNR
jgi:predicted nucleic acid-binding protein